MTRQSWRELTFSCWTVTQFIVALLLQVVLKMQHLYNFFMQPIKCKNILTAAEARFLLHESHKTDRLTPYSRQNTLKLT
jgi:hypothetical protein